MLAATYIYDNNNIIILITMSIIYKKIKTKIKHLKKKV